MFHSNVIINPQSSRLAFTHQSGGGGGGGNVLYGCNGYDTSNRGALLTIDSDTGVGTIVGTPDASKGLSGIDFHPDGRLFASTAPHGSPFHSRLFQINKNDGSLISDIGDTTIAVSDLAFQPSTGILFGLTGNVPGYGRIYTINLSTAAVTLVGNTGLNNNGGLAFHPDGTFYVLIWGGTTLYTISPVDASTIDTLTIDTSASWSGLTVRSNGDIFATDGGSDNIWSINSSTGHVTLVGSSGQGNLSDLAFG